MGAPARELAWRYCRHRAQVTHAHTRAHTHTRTHTHARTHRQTDARTHTNTRAYAHKSHLGQLFPDDGGKVVPRGRVPLQTLLLQLEQRHEVLPARLDRLPLDQRRQRARVLQHERVFELWVGRRGGGEGLLPALDAPLRCLRGSKGEGNRLIRHPWRLDRVC